MLLRPFALRTRPCGRFAFVEDERLQASCNADGPPVGQAHQTCIRQRTFRAGAATRPPRTGRRIRVAPLQSNLCRIPGLSNRPVWRIAADYGGPFRLSQL